MNLFGAQAVQNPDSPQRHRFALTLLLGAMFGLLPLTMDMYLPTMPELQRVFSASPARVEYTLSTFFVGFSIGQAFFGPIIDRYGRKRPLLIGLVLYALASIGCALSPSIEMLSALRVVQALGVCAGGVTARAVVRDLFEPQEAAHVFSALMLVSGVAPIVAPVIGSYLLMWLGWSSIFWALALAGLTVCVAAMVDLPETFRPAEFPSMSLKEIVFGYARLFVHREFMGYTISGSLVGAGMFAYIAGSPFVFIEVFHMLPQHYGWLFAVNSVGVMGGAYANTFLLRRTRAETVLRVALVMEALFGLTLLAAAMSGVAGAASVEMALFLYIASLGFVFPIVNALALAPFGRNAGIASALIGTLRFGAAALASMAVGAFHVLSAVPMGAIIAGCGVTGLIVHCAMIGGGFEASQELSDAASAEAASEAASVASGGPPT